jgi:hypothetical protein
VQVTEGDGYCLGRVLINAQMQHAGNGQFRQQRGGRHLDPPSRCRHLTAAVPDDTAAGAAGFLLLTQCRERPET